MVDDLPHPVAGHDRWSSDDGRVQVGGWWAGTDSLGVGAYWDRRPSGVTGFSGHVWIDDEPWREGRSWAAQLGDRCGSFDVSRDVERLGGRFTLFHIRADGTGWATADPLGLGMLYRAETPEVVIVSNRSDLAARFALSPGARSIPRDVEAMGLLALTGTLHGDRTGFEAVRIVPQASILHLDRNGGARVETWSPMPWWDGDAPGPLDDAVACCLDRFRARVRLMAAPAAHRATCELTGGKDSRLMLALLLVEGMAHDIEYRTWGTTGSPDVTLATTLTERFHLDHRVGQGPLVLRSGPRPGDDPPPTVSNDGWRVRAIDYETRLRHHVWASSGALSIWDLHTTTWPPVSGVALCGLVGEVLRTNYSSTDRIETMGRLERFIGRGGFGFDAAGLLSADAATHLRALVVEQIRSLVPPGGDARDAVDGFYQRGRLRRWGGAQAELSTRHRVSPLYDLQAIRAAFAIGSEARRSELLHRRLLDACTPDLARVPFTRQAADEKRTQLPIAWDIALLPARRRLHRSRHRFVIDLVRRRRPSPNVSESSRMRGMTQKRAVLRSLLDLPTEHPTWDLYDRRRTLDALDRIEDLPTLGRADLHHAATVATWLDHGERRADIFTSAPGG